MSNADTDWKAERTHWLEHSRAFFGNKNKRERERWAAIQLLRALNIDFEEHEVNAAEEPADVKFRDARFQVKEIVDENRRRGDEIRASLRQVAGAQTQSDLLEHFDPQEISFSEITTMCFEHAKAIESNYGNREVGSIDLLVYFNWINHFVTGPFVMPTGPTAFRSLSIVSNSCCGVAYASEKAPTMLRSRVGEALPFDVA